jgi:hypothetical protein
MNGSQSSARKKYLYPASTRRKMSLAKLGKKLTPQHRRAIAKALRAYYAKVVRDGAC